MTAQPTQPNINREATDDQVAHARRLREDAGFEPFDRICPRCGDPSAFGYKVIDDIHEDEKQQCFLCGFRRYVDGPKRPTLRHPPRRRSAPMTRKHIISLDDFKDYKIETQLASSSSEQKRLIVEVTLGGQATFRVSHSYHADGIHATLADAIRDYNNR